MQLQPLSTVRFSHPADWEVELTGPASKMDVELVIDLSELVWEAPAG